MGHIYCITNSINGKQYVGKTEIDVQERFEQHKGIRNCPRDKNRPLYRAMRKYGVENFTVEELETVEDVSMLSERESFWIAQKDTFRHGYNCTRGGDGTVKYNYKKIYETWQSNHNIMETARIVGCDRRVVRKVLKEEGIINPARPSHLSVVAIDRLTGELRYSFDSIKQAVKFFNKTSRVGLTTACKDLSKTFCGYRWRYTEEYDPNTIYDQIKNTPNKTLYDRTNGYRDIVEYLEDNHSITEAMKFFDCSRASIYKIQKIYLRQDFSII